MHKIRAVNRVKRPKNNSSPPIISRPPTIVGNASRAMGIRALLPPEAGKKPKTCRYPWSENVKAKMMRNRERAYPSQEAMVCFMVSPCKDRSDVRLNAYWLRRAGLLD